MSVSPGREPEPNGPEFGPFRPSRRQVTKERLAFLNVVRMIRRVRPQPVPVSGVPVLLIPGFLAGDWSLRLVASRLRTDGHPTFGSGIRVNADCTERLTDRIERRLVEVADRAEGRVAIVGHSRGGTLAKLVALRRPDLVTGIVTMASPNVDPFAASESTLKQAGLLVRLGRWGVRGVIDDDCLAGACADHTRAEIRKPIPAGLFSTSIYTKDDAVVDWRACLDPSAKHVEVTGSHTGMAASPAVYRAVRSELGPSLKGLR